MSETAEKQERRSFSQAAWGLAKNFKGTLILGGAGVVAAPTNETAAIAAGIGFFYDIAVMIKDKGEQAASNMGIETKKQKSANKVMREQIRTREEKNLDDRMKWGS